MKKRTFINIFLGVFSFNIFFLSEGILLFEKPVQQNTFDLISNTVLVNSKNFERKKKEKKENVW